MRLNLTRPCSNCPFRREPQFPLGVIRREEIAQSLTRDGNTFACHKTTRFDDNGLHQPHEQEQHCAGAMIVLEKHHRPNIAMRLARRFGNYNPEQLQEVDAVYDSLQEFATAED